MTKAVYTCTLEVADGTLNVRGNVNLKQQLKEGVRNILCSRPLRSALVLEMCGKKEVSFPRCFRGYH